jgi:histidyl-tRNA synthetase
LTELGFADFRIRLNHRQLLTSILNLAGIPEPLHGNALIALDKLDKVGVEGVAAEFEQRGIPVAAEALIERIRGFQAKPGSMAGAFDDPGEQAWRNVAKIVYLTVGTPAEKHVDLDLSLARGLSYYTGAIMEINVPDLAGSLGGGGRYDNLIGMFLGRDIPACGFSLGLERIIVVMTEQKMFPAKISGAAVDVMVAFLSEDLKADALKLAGEIRAEKLRVDVYPEVSAKLEKPLKYASARNVPVMAILGEDERARGEVSVRDLQTRRQESIPRASAATTIANRVRLVEP